MIPLFRGRRLRRGSTWPGCLPRGISQAARDTGITREGLYEALSEDRSRSFATTLTVLTTLGLRLHIEPNVADIRLRAQDATGQLNSIALKMFFGCASARPQSGLASASK